MVDSARGLPVSRHPWRRLSRALEGVAIHHINRTQPLFTAPYLQTSAAPCTTWFEGAGFSGSLFERAIAGYRVDDPKVSEVAPAAVKQGAMQVVTEHSVTG